MDGILARAEEGERNLDGPGGRAIQDRQKPDAAASCEGGHFTDLGDREHDRLIPDSGEALEQRGARVFQDVSGVGRVGEQGRGEDGGAGGLVRPGRVAQRTRGSQPPPIFYPGGAQQEVPCLVVPFQGGAIQ